VTTRDKKAHTHTTQQKTQVGRIAMWRRLATDRRAQTDEKIGTDPGRAPPSLSTCDWSLSRLLPETINLPKTTHFFRRKKKTVFPKTCYLNLFLVKASHKCCTDVYNVEVCVLRTYLSRGAQLFDSKRNLSQLPIARPQDENYRFRWE
jgi:hypothetical protein